MLICLAAPRPATAELAQIRNADLNLIDLAQSTHPPTTPAIRSRTSISPLDRLASTHTPSPRRSNPHSARGTATPSLIAVSSLGGFPTPALRARGTVIIGPASENLHIATESSEANACLFDHLVGEREQPAWNMGRFRFSIKSDSLLAGRRASRQPLHDELGNEKPHSGTPAHRRRRGPSHRAVGCGRGSCQQAAEGGAFHPDLRSGLRLSHSAATDANPATCRPVVWRRHGVLFGGRCPLPPSIQCKARCMARTHASAVDLVPAQCQLSGVRAGAPQCL